MVDPCVELLKQFLLLADNLCVSLLALPTEGKDIVVFRFIIEYSSLRVFGAYVVGLFLIWGFLKDDSLACVETWD
jgi:hypothetical protein